MLPEIKKVRVSKSYKRQFFKEWHTKWIGCKTLKPENRLRLLSLKNIQILQRLDLIRN
jgi:hypothetical protein